MKHEKPLALVLGVVIVLDAPWPCGLLSLLAQRGTVAAGGQTNFITHEPLVPTGGIVKLSDEELAKLRIYGDWPTNKFPTIDRYIPLVLQEDDEIKLSVNRIWTNHLPTTLSIVSTTPVEIKCRECGHLHYHDQQVVVMKTTDQLCMEVSSHGTTNPCVVLHTWPASAPFMRTNILERQQRAQPGWPPLPAPMRDTTNSIR